MVYSFVCKNITAIGVIVFELRAWPNRITDRNALPSHSPPGERVTKIPVNIQTNYTIGKFISLVSFLCVRLYIANII